jgi:transposase
MVTLVVMGNRGDLTNEQWERIEALLPKAKTNRGRPAQDHRKLLNGMVWVLRTGAPWRDMPERYGKWTTIYSRFQRWRKAGVWARMFAELQTALDVESKVDWEIHFIDSTTVRAHQHAAGAKKAVPNKKP